MAVKVFVPLSAWILAGLGSAVVMVQAQVTEDPAHAELRRMRTNIIDAISSGDIKTTLKHCHTNVVVTWQNAEVCRGHAGLEEFFHRLGREAWKGYLVPPTPDQLTILHGDDTGISFGRTVSRYSLLGQNLIFTNRWTATVVKERGEWLLASYHISLNALDNPILSASKKGLVVTGVGGLLAGLALGILLSRRRRRNA